MSPIIALTGATGFIGGALIRRLQETEWRVRALARPASRRDHLSGVEARWIEGDLEDPESLRRLVRGADAVVHCAGAVRGRTRNHFFRVNRDGVARLLKAAVREHPPPRFLLVSSLAAREPHLSPYAASKRAGEAVLAAGAGRMPWAALRPSVVYGPGDREVLPLFRSMYRGVAPVTGPPGARFSMLYVDDLAGAILKWLARGGTRTRIFEVHDGTPGGYGWGDLIRITARLRGGPVRRIRVPAVLLAAAAAVNIAAARITGYDPMLTPGKVREIGHPRWVCDNTPLIRETGWSPRVRLEEGLRRVLDFRR